ncbi:hypothetical protein [Streptomyces sp. NPDC002671]
MDGLPMEAAHDRAAKALGLTCLGPLAWGFLVTLGRRVGLRGRSPGLPQTTVRDGWIERAFPQFLGIPAPAKVERVTRDGDPHWGNLRRSHRFQRQPPRPVIPGLTMKFARLLITWSVTPQPEKQKNPR